MTATPSSATPANAPSNARSLLLLVVWIGVAVVALWWGRSTPEVPQQHAEEQAVEARKAKWISRDVQQWRVEHGDRRIGWEDAAGHLTIVIDDVGRELEAHAALQSLRYPLTFSVLPGSVYAAGAQLRLREDPRRYREIWLHMPMEPLDATQMSRGAEAQENFLTVDDSPQQRRHKLEVAIREVPAAIGLNNHMGSRLTADPVAMDEVAAFLAERELLFLDSRTTAATVAADAASRAGVPLAQRRVFLDHDMSPQAMHTALAQAIEAAKGEPIVAIGHPSMALAAVLEEGLDIAHAQKVGIYPLSELIAHTSQGARNPQVQLTPSAP